MRFQWRDSGDSDSGPTRPAAASAARRGLAGSAGLTPGWPGTGAGAGHVLTNQASLSPALSGSHAPRKVAGRGIKSR